MWANALGQPFDANDPLFLPVYRPSPTTCDWRRPGTRHQSAMLVALADGSVRSINSSVTSQILWMAAKPDDGHPLPSDW